MLERYWTPNTPYLNGIPFDGRRLDFSRPVVHLVQEAGLVTTGAHKYKIAWLDAGGTTLCTDHSATVTTDTATAGKVYIPCPLYAGYTAGPEKPDGATGWNIYRTEAAGSDYKLVNASPITSFVGYLDNIADASLGAAEPGSKTSTTVNNPTLLATSIAALTAGSDTDYLIAYFAMQSRWTLLAGSENNTLLFVPGTWATDAATYKWPVDPQGRGWTADDTAVAAITIASYSTTWAAMYLLINYVAHAHFIHVTIDVEDQNNTPEYTVTVDPAGGTTISLEEGYTVDEQTVPLMVCKLILQALHDPDWY